MRWTLRQPSIKMPRQVEDSSGGLPNLFGHFQVSRPQSRVEIIQRHRCDQ